ncbi:ribosomal RNA small subunit methyltransferase A [bacterium]|nr:ribosomal RNA small subunit methyltransferase A [bacterium]
MYAQKVREPKTLGSFKVPYRRKSESQIGFVKDVTALGKTVCPLAPPRRWCRIQWLNYAPQAGVSRLFLAPEPDFACTHAPVYPRVRGNLQKLSRVGEVALRRTSPGCFDRLPPRSRRLRATSHGVSILNGLRTAHVQACKKTAVPVFSSVGKPNNKKNAKRAERPAPSSDDVRGMSPEELEEQLKGMRDRLERHGFSADKEAGEDRLAAPIGYARKHGGLPATKKSLGQNWLEDEDAVDAMVRTLSPQEGETVLEVGPGGGALTAALLETGAQVTAVEIDRRMVEYLEERYGKHDNFTLVHADILRESFSDLARENPFHLVGNLPYHITSSLLFNAMEYAIEHPGQIRSLLVLIQKEVAERIVAEPGSSEYGILSVFTRLWGEPELVRIVPRASFKPAPKVDAGILYLKMAAEPLYPLPHWPTLKRLVKGTFNKRRKMLRNSMPGIPHIGPWQDLDFDWTRRPQTVSAEEFARIAQQLIPKRKQI